MTIYDPNFLARFRHGRRPARDIRLGSFDDRVQATVAQIEAMGLDATTERLVDAFCSLVAEEQTPIAAERLQGLWFAWRTDQRRAGTIAPVLRLVASRARRRLEATGTIPPRRRDG